MSAGDYNQKFILLKRTPNKESAYGQDEDTFTPSGELWGYSEELTAGERMAYGVKQSEVDLKIHIRNFPAVDFKDRLQDKATGEVYLIDGIVNGADELVITAHAQRK